MCLEPDCLEPKLERWLCRPCRDVIINGAPALTQRRNGRNRVIRAAVPGMRTAAGRLNLNIPVAAMLRVVRGL